LSASTDPADNGIALFAPTRQEVSVSAISPSQLKTLIFWTGWDL